MDISLQKPMVSVSPIDKSRKKITRTMSKTDLRELSEREEGFDSRSDSLDRVLFLGSGLDEIVVDEECDVVGVRDWKLGGVVVGGGAGYGGGGSLTGGGGGGGGGGGSGGGDGDGSSGYWDSNHGNNITEEYYQKMIDAYPGDALLLSNSAKFLKEIADSYFTLLRKKPYSWYSLQQKKGLGGAASVRETNLTFVFVDDNNGSHPFLRTRSQGRRSLLHQNPPQCRGSYSSLYSYLIPNTYFLSSSLFAFFLNFDFLCDYLCRIILTNQRI
ncbi:keratin-3, type I cytoskeletal 51 kDa-like [Camellia sinensis]|uniref:keratin-3, type I cytoskeletal 51 kDa-like n=1 Tax=Camellia sinensis TaxID=4442 RepID=UPI001035A1B1|nr:keratin-3, type I cytoskeletal 51 kDa-like [Camellia sinensis]